jgi:hypothetical protein
VQRRDAARLRFDRAAHRLSMSIFWLITSSLLCDERVSSRMLDVM